MLEDSSFGGERREWAEGELYPHDRELSRSETTSEMWKEASEGTGIDE
jgi:hypothetical protein